MKKGILVAAFMATAGLASAQGLYVGVGGGYGFGTPGEVLGTKQNVTTSGTTESNIVGSLGGGINTGLNVGYMLSENFGVDLGFNYFLGSQVTTTDVTTPTGNITLKSKTSQVRIAPSLVVSTSGDVRVYGKAGLVLPVSGKTISEYRDNTTASSVVERDAETKGAISLGFQGAIGVDYGISDKLSIFGELSGVSLRIKSATMSMTKYTVNGADQMGSLNTYDKETTFVEELTPSSNNSNYNPSGTNTGSAKEELSGRTNFNGLFINVGVKINLN